MRYGIPTVIWSASIGPYTAEPKRETQMAEFLRKVDLITVRESATVDYLNSIGVNQNVVPVHDVAFSMAPAPYSGPEVDFLASGNVVALNVSALILKWYNCGDTAVLVREIARFIEYLTEQRFKVLLIPHVYEPGGELPMNDSDFLRLILDQVKALGEKVSLLSGNVSAANIKWVISQCRFFFGARTHATIAAVSSGVPTIAIAYSAKARGIWQDIFGHTGYLLETDKLSTETLMRKMQLLIKEEESIRKTLNEKRQEMLDGACKNAVALAALLRRKSCL
jgi:polysaccharide pyruvyl transferase WcaK-like protein